MAMTAEKLAYYKAYREAHREETRAAQKRWYDEHGKESREKRVDAVLEQARAYYHRVKDTDKAKEYAIANKDKKSAYHSEWQKAHRPELNEYNRERWIQTAYRDVIGVPADGPAANCEICGSDSDICMDHCHETNTFRGWLCRACNLRVGRPHANYKLKKRIIAYLEKFQERQKVNSAA